MNNTGFSILSALLAAACTSSGAGDATGSVDEGGADLGTSDGDGAEASGDGAGSGVDLGPGGSDGDGTTGGDNPQDPILPLTYGRWWEYEPVDDGSLYDCAGPGPYISEVIGAMTLEGRPAAAVRQAFPECDFDDVYYEDRGGDDIWRFFPAEDDPWSPFMLPPEDDLSWTVEPLLLDMRWRRIGEFTVPAGTFDDCWARETSYAVGSRQGQGGDYVYCRGVGLVSLELFFDGGATLQLVDYGE